MHACMHTSCTSRQINRKLDSDAQFRDTKDDFAEKPPARRSIFLADGTNFRSINTLAAGVSLTVTFENRLNRGRSFVAILMVRTWDELDLLKYCYSKNCLYLYYFSLLYTVHVVLENLKISGNWEKGGVIKLRSEYSKFGNNSCEYFDSVSVKIIAIVNIGISRPRNLVFSIHN